MHSRGRPSLQSLRIFRIFKSDVYVVALADMADLCDCDKALFCVLLRAGVNPADILKAILVV